MVSDPQILRAQKWLAARKRKVPKNANIVCTVTGHGQKEFEAPFLAGRTPRTCAANADAVRKALRILSREPI